MILWFGEFMLLLVLLLLVYNHCSSSQAIRAVYPLYPHMPHMPNVTIIKENVLFTIRISNLVLRAFPFENVRAG